MTIIVTFNEIATDLPSFRESNMLETFTEYADAVLPEAIIAYWPTIKTLYCINSGFAYAEIHAAEIAHMVRAACSALKMDDRFGDPFAEHSDADIADAIETVLDHMSMTSVHLRRKAPSLIYSNNRFAIALFDRDRQLSILINQLLARAIPPASRREEEVIHARNIAASQIADRVRNLFGSDDSLGVELLSTLAELDAKYRIANVNFSMAEASELKAFSNSDSFEFVDLQSFVGHLIAVRDLRNEPLADAPNQWTNTVYRVTTEQMGKRLAYSNFEPEESTVGHIANKAAAAKATQKPKTPEQRNKAIQKRNILDAISAILG